jgi:hypothetical protein
MHLRIRHKLSMLVNFPRQVLIELAAIRAAQTRLEEGFEKWRLSASGRLDNFLKISFQNEDTSERLIVNIKQQIDDLEATLRDLKQKTLESEQTNGTVRDRPNSNQNQNP